MDVGGVLTALARDEDVHRRQRGDVVRVLHRRDSLADGRRGATRLGSGEEDGIDQIEIPFLAHTLHEHGTHHATPTDNACLHLRIVAAPGPRSRTRPALSVAVGRVLHCRPAVSRGYYESSCLAMV